MKVYLHVKLVIIPTQLGGESEAPYEGAKSW